MRFASGAFVCPLPGLVGDWNCGFLRLPRQRRIISLPLPINGLALLQTPLALADPLAFYMSTFQYHCGHFIPAYLIGAILFSRFASSAHHD